MQTFCPGEKLRYLSETEGNRGFQNSKRLFILKSTIFEKKKRFELTFTTILISIYISV